MPLSIHGWCQLLLLPIWRGASPSRPLTLRRAGSEWWAAWGHLGQRDGGRGLICGRQKEAGTGVTQYFQLERKETDFPYTGMLQSCLLQEMNLKLYLSFGTHFFEEKWQFNDIVSAGVTRIWRKWWGWYIKKWPKFGIHCYTSRCLQIRPERRKNGFLGL